MEVAYRLIDLGGHDWRFEESSLVQFATLEFDRIIQKSEDDKSLRCNLKKFLQQYPNHIDALHHYATSLLYVNKVLEAFAFSQTAVAVGCAAFPKEFTPGPDRLCTGFIQNRPFLRALHGLIMAKEIVGLQHEAIKTAQMCLALDPNDRFGARDTLVRLLIESNQDEAALALFEQEQYKGTFWGVEYLHAFARIRCGQIKEAKQILSQCLKYHPFVARYILDLSLPAVPPGPFGISTGSEEEGWHHASRFGNLWRTSKTAMTLLAEVSQPYIARGWCRPN